jgi:hypothetical protein
MENVNPSQKDKIYWIKAPATILTVPANVKEVPLTANTGISSDWSARRGLSDLVISWYGTVANDFFALAT